MKPIVLSLATLLAIAVSSRAQEIPAPSRSTSYSNSADVPPASREATYGLIGQEYSGAEFGYTHHVDGPPSVMRRYGFVANRPLTAGVDTSFNYNYTTGSALGVQAHQNDAAAGVTGYLPMRGFKPFVNGEAGWAWTHAGGTRSDSFAYLLGTGAEVQILRQLSLTPFVNYQEEPHFHAHVWNYGTKANFRLVKEWSTSLTAQIDEHHNIEYALGLNRHF